MKFFQARILEWVAMPSSRGIFPTWGSNLGLPHCRWILYYLSHQGSPRILELVAYPFSRESSWPRNQTRVSCIAGGFFTTRATKKAQSKHYKWQINQRWFWAIENQSQTTEHRVAATSHEIGRIQNMTSEQIFIAQEGSKILSWTRE